MRLTAQLVSLELPNEIMREETDGLDTRGVEFDHWSLRVVLLGFFVFVVEETYGVHSQSDLLSLVCLEATR